MKACSRCKKLIMYYGLTDLGLPLCEECLDRRLNLNLNYAHTVTQYDIDLGYNFDQSDLGKRYIIVTGTIQFLS